MTYVIDNGYVYVTKEVSVGVTKSLVGSVTKTETERINETTVSDVTYQFDIELGQYIEQSRIERQEPLPALEPSPEEIQIQTLLNTEYLVVMSELTNL